MNSDINILALFGMIFMHIVDDFYLQGILAKMKQKDWWKQEAPDALYKNDYMIALILHAFSWTFMVMLPITVLMIVQDKFNIHFYLFFFVLNWFIHTLTDHLKANKKTINLIIDQIVHILQIVYTWINFMGLILDLL